MVPKHGELCRADDPGAELLSLLELAVLERGVRHRQETGPVRGRDPAVAQPVCRGDLFQAGCLLAGQLPVLERVDEGLEGTLGNRGPGEVLITSAARSSTARISASTAFGS